MDAGLQQAAGISVVNPLPPSWMGLANSPPDIPSWAYIGGLSTSNIRALLAQIGYDQSAWNYKLIGANNQLGRYQFATTTLENYGLLLPGSNSTYGTNCVNYQVCWSAGTIPKTSFNAYTNYLYNTTNITTFLNNVNAQEHLAYQLLSDLYSGLVKINAITSTDTVDVVGGMMYVAWVLGIGAPANNTNTSGSGAYAWRYHGGGAGTTAFNSGRYAVTILSQ